MIVKVVMSSETRTPALSYDSECSVIDLRSHVSDFGDEDHRRTFATGSVGLYDTIYLGPEDALTMTRRSNTVISLTFMRCSRALRPLLTSLIIQLLQHFPNNLSYTLDGLEIFFRLVIRLLLITDVQSN